MNEGTLRFTIDGKEVEDFFEDLDLKSGPIWFAVALNNDTCVLIL